MGSNKVAEDKEFWNFRLYIAGSSDKSMKAIGNLKKICDKYLAGKYKIEIVDLSANPARAHEDGIIALPTLVRKLPPPIKKIIGDLSKQENVLIGLGVKDKSGKTYK